MDLRDTWMGCPLPQPCAPATQVRPFPGTGTPDPWVARRSSSLTALLVKRTYTSPDSTPRPRVRETMSRESVGGRRGAALTFRRKVASLCPQRPPAPGAPSPRTEVTFTHRARGRCIIHGETPGSAGTRVVHPRPAPLQTRVTGRGGAGAPGGAVDVRARPPRLPHVPPALQGLPTGPPLCVLIWFW